MCSYLGHPCALVGICSFKVLVFWEWKGISWIINHVFHHDLAFSSLYFVSVALSKLMSISAFRPSLRPSNSLVIFFIQWTFCYIFWLPYFSPKSFISLASSCWYFFVSCPPSYFLSFFWNILFCLCCFSLCWYFFILPSFASTFCVFSLSCIVIFSSIDFSFFLHMFQRLSFV